jgi:O-antigen/teichoic acid export membrane protein
MTIPTPTLEAPPDAPRRLLSDPMLRNAALGLVLTGLMAGAGALFWVIAARLAPAADVGLAGSLVTATEALAVLSLLGYNVALVRTMPTSERPAADVRAAVSRVTLMAAGLALGYALLLPLTSPRLAEVVHPAVVPLFALWVAATALNQLTDAVFLAVDRVVANLWVNGVAMGIVKCVLPFLMAGAGAFWLYGSVGTAAAIAALVSLAVIVARLPRGLWHQPSQQLRDQRRFAQAGYLFETLYLVPQLTFPLIVVNALGAEANARYFVSFQVVTMLNMLVYVVGHSMFASAERDPAHAHATVRRGGLTIVAATTAGAVALVVLAPYLLLVFGSGYADEGTDVLRILALGAFGVGINFWSAIRLRIANHLREGVAVQLLTTALMVAAALLVAPYGVEWVALVWGLGGLLGGVLGCAVHAVLTHRQGRPA